MTAKVKDRWEPYNPPYHRCDLCDRMPSWRHPEGGFRCNKCPKYTDQSFTRKLSSFRIKWTQQWFEKIWDEIEDFSPAEYKSFKKKIKVLKRSTGVRDIRLFRIYKIKKNK